MDNELPRLFRFDLVDEHILCELDEEHNVLHINQYLFDRLPPHQQQEVFNTKAKVLTIDHF